MTHGLDTLRRLNDEAVLHARLGIQPPAALPQAICNQACIVVTQFADNSLQITSLGVGVDDEPEDFCDLLAFCLERTLRELRQEAKSKSMTWQEFIKSCGS